MRTILIVGGGVSGTLVAAGLLRATHPLRIVVVEPRPTLGRGLAYSTRCCAHLMNVPAGKLSLVEEQPNHFVEWLRENFYSWATDYSFVPRSVYGRYVGDCLAVRRRAARPGVDLQHVRLEVIRMEPKAAGYRAYLSDGSSLSADAVVLATGNPPPSDEVIPEGPFRRSGRYFPSAWHPGALDCVNQHGAVLLLGSGLTAIDAAVALEESGHRGVIHLVSRHGLLPRAHPRRRPANALGFGLLPAPLRQLVAQVRREAARTGTGGWRPVVDALRADTPSLWQRLTPEDQRRFLRHVRVYWDVHRHRMAPDVASMIARMMEQGRVQVHAGRIQQVRLGPAGVEVEVRPRGRPSPKCLSVDRLINCTAPESDYRKLKHPLWTSLFASRLIDAGPLGMGLKTTEQGELVTPDGRVLAGVFTLGPPRLGSLWETTAIPEIRIQAATLISRLPESTALAPVTGWQERSQWFCA
jgi:uncharacterized NAD(P)/FAD-binding protein YdhS